MTVFRPLTLDELKLVLDWAAAEGWNPGLDDAAPFYAADPAGFFVCEVAGKPVAAISVVNHNDQHAFLGLYICEPEHRGRGIAYGLWRHALQHAGTRTVGLDGVPDQQANYARSGFGLIGATTRYQGTLAEPVGHSTTIRPATAADHDRLTALDARANGHERTAFLKAWLTQSATRQTLVVDGGNGPRGFVTIRQCRDGAKIGPLVADDQDTALALVSRASALFPGGPLFLDLPAHQTGFATRIEALGFMPGFTTARMYRGIPPRAHDSLWCIATMELG